MKKFYFLPVSMAFLIFAGCATKVPITTNIINEVGGVENTKKFQYYVSKTITLNLVAENTASTIEGGQLIRRSQTARDKIVIKGNLPGLVRKGQSRTTAGFQLEVAFEEYAGNPMLKFGQYSNETAKDTYKLLYADPKSNTVTYGNDRYLVTYDNKKHIGQPYLLIKMKKSETKSAKARKAKGLKL